MSEVHGRKREKTSEEIVKARRAKEAGKIQEYNGLVGDLRHRMSSGEYTTETLLVTTKLLRQNPDYYTVWNHRRVVLQRGILQSQGGEDDQEQKEQKEHDQKVFLQELELFMQLIRINPKSYWLWNHRLWCLRTMPRPSWEGELHLVNKMLTMDARNFHGWTYRRVVVEHLRQLTGNAKEDYAIVQQEYDFTTQKINQSFSNYSAWHQRSKLLPEIVADMSEDEKNDVARNEFEMIQNAIYTDPDDQSAWLYYWWLLGKAPSHVTLVGVYNVGDGNLLFVFNDMVRFSQFPTVLDAQQHAVVGQWLPMETAISKASSYTPGDSGAVWLFSVAPNAPQPASIAIHSNNVFPISSAMTMDTDKTWTNSIKDVPLSSDKWNSIVSARRANSKPITLARRYNDPMAQDSSNWYSLDPIQTLENEIQVVRDLIDCEPESKWALQTLSHFLQQLRLRSGANASTLDNESISIVDQLITLDSYRANRYKEMKNRIMVRRAMETILKEKEHGPALLAYLFDL
ncbi:hypothetical protein BC940DRAFT_366633 [Gongronella butleri]|nr:hypothetical protein BC940DRAFT_366633 [Gongronella butleri]